MHLPVWTMRLRATGATRLRLHANRAVLALIGIGLVPTSDVVAQTLLRVASPAVSLPTVTGPDISGDGRVALFAGRADQWSGGSAEAQVLVALDRTTGVATVVAPLFPGTADHRFLSANGRFVLYTGDPDAGQPVLRRDLDIATDVPLPTAARAVARGMSADGGRVLLGVSGAVAGLRTLYSVAGAPPEASVIRITITCAARDGLGYLSGTLSDDGNVVVFPWEAGRGSGAPLPAPPVGLGIFDASLGQTDCHALNAPDVAAIGAVYAGSADGGVIAFPVALTSGGSRVAVLDRSRRLHLLAAPTDIDARVFTPADIDLSRDGRYLVTTWSLPNDATSADRRVGDVYVTDRVTGDTRLVSVRLDGTASRLGGAASARARISANGRYVIFTSTADLLSGAPTLLTEPLGFIADLDADGDGLHDAWERRFGMNPSDPADASFDPDGDGRTSRQEYDAGTHPTGTPVRYFAEGADADVFRTSLALFNPGTTAVVANVRVLGADGAAASTPVSVPAGGPAFLDLHALGLAFTEFSLIVESPAPLVAERRMTWDPASGYGSHSGTGVAAPSTTWHFAEGATTAGFQTFLLLQNPGDVPSVATVRYLLADGGTYERQHTVPARSRLTVWANAEGGAMTGAEFGTTVVSDQPLVAERAMYRDGPAQVFAAGSVVSGVSTPGTTWLFAEGATGAFFDTYLLLANPGDTPVTVDAEFILAYVPGNIDTAFPIARQYVLAPRSRRTIWVREEDPLLRDTQVGVRVMASGPIVAERSMWWPGPTPATWHEVHAETGATAGGRLWAVADVQADAAAGGWDTFLLVATTEQNVALIRVTATCGDGTRIARDLPLSVNRTTLWMRYEFPEIIGKRCAATVESLPARITSSPSVPLRRVPLFVEKAMYYGPDFAAGDASLATRLPDPVDEP